MRDKRDTSNRRRSRPGRRYTVLLNRRDRENSIPGCKPPPSRGWGPWIRSWAVPTSPPGSDRRPSRQALSRLRSPPKLYGAVVVHHRGVVLVACGGHDEVELWGGHAHGLCLTSTSPPQGNAIYAQHHFRRNPQSSRSCRKASEVRGDSTSKRPHFNDGMPARCVRSVSALSLRMCRTRAFLAAPTVQFIRVSSLIPSVSCFSRAVLPPCRSSKSAHARSFEAFSALRWRQLWYLPLRLRKHRPIRFSRPSTSHASPTAPMRQICGNAHSPHDTCGLARHGGQNIARAPFLVCPAPSGIGPPTVA